MIVLKIDDSVSIMLKAVTTKKVFYTSATFLGYSKYVNGFCFSKWLARSHYSSESTGKGRYYSFNKTILFCVLFLLYIFFHSGFSCNN